MSGLLSNPINAQVKQVYGDAFDIRYDASVYKAGEITNVPSVPGYFTQTLLRKDGKGMIFIMSSLADRTLDDYAYTSLMSNRIFAGTGQPPTSMKVGNRQSLFTTFTNNGDSGRVWFFQENGRFLSFITLDADDNEPGRKVLTTLKIHPAKDDGISKLTESEIVAIFQSIAAKLQNTSSNTLIRTCDIRVDQERKLLYFTFCCNIKDSQQLESIKAWLRTPADTLREECIRT